jgi:DNA repair protein RadC
MQNNSYKYRDIDFNTLSDSDTLSLIIGKRSIDKCRYVLAEVGNNLLELSKLNINELINRGFTRREAYALLASLEIGKRKNYTEAIDRYTIRSSRDSYDVFKHIMTGLVYEEFHVMYINRANKILKHHKISSGGVTGTVADIRSIYKMGIDLLASGIIVCHNHPSGSLIPSEADNKLTEKIKAAGIIIGISLIDHIIITDNDYYSYADNGLIL